MSNGRKLSTQCVCDMYFLANPRYTKAAVKVKTDDDLLKGVRKYIRTARKAWEALSIPEDQEIDLEGLYSDHQSIRESLQLFRLSLERARH